MPSRHCGLQKLDEKSVHFRIIGDLYPLSPD
jgi:hypothetical protein